MVPLLAEAPGKRELCPVQMVPSGRPPPGLASVFWRIGAFLALPALRGGAGFFCFVFEPNCVKYLGGEARRCHCRRAISGCAPGDAGQALAWCPGAEGGWGSLGSWVLGASLTFAPLQCCLSPVSVVAGTALGGCWPWEWGAGRAPLPALGIPGHWSHWCGVRGLPAALLGSGKGGNSPTAVPRSCPPGFRVPGVAVGRGFGRAVMPAWREAVLPWRCWPTDCRDLALRGSPAWPRRVSPSRSLLPRCLWQQRGRVRTAAAEQDAAVGARSAASVDVEMPSGQFWDPPRCCWCDAGGDRCFPWLLSLLPLRGLQPLRVCSSGALQSSAVRGSSPLVFPGM